MPILIDFGIAKTSESELTKHASVLGTFAYMSPEQDSDSTAKLVDARSDIYSAGVVLYEMITGRRPFEGGREEVRDRRRSTTPSAPSTIVQSIPRALDDIIATAMAVAPGDRYPTASKFKAALLSLDEATID
jgi:serine/threonine-protein kinase